jgi:hypothetical protein
MAECFTFTDTCLTKPETLPNGFLSVWARVTRPGVVTYDRPTIDNPNRKMRIFRDAINIFSKDCMDSFIGAWFTDRHPEVDGVPAVLLENVDATKQYRCGTVKQVIQDGDWLAANIILEDSKIISDVLSGRKWVSVGWQRAEVSCPGTKVLNPVTQLEETVDAIQTDLRCNHIALVPSGHTPRMGAGSAISIDYEVNVEKEVAPVVPVEVAPVVPVETVTQIAIPEVAVEEPEEELVLKSSYDQLLADLSKATASYEVKIKTLTEDLTNAHSPAVLDLLVAARAELCSLAQAWSVDYTPGIPSETLKTSILTKAYPKIRLDEHPDASYRSALWDALPAAPVTNKDISVDSTPALPKVPESIPVNLVDVSMANNVDEAKSQFYQLFRGKQ